MNQIIADEVKDISQILADIENKQALTNVLNSASLLRSLLEKKNLTKTQRKHIQNHLTDVRRLAIALKTAL